MVERFNRIEWDDQGLIPVIVQDHETHKVLMFAWMNREALQKTMELRQAVYFSRSRRKLWFKGEESGHVQRVKSLRMDCDQDVLLLRVEVAGAEATCHTGRRSCFYRRVEMSGGKVSLVIADNERKFDPQLVYHQT